MSLPDIAQTEPSAQAQIINSDSPPEALLQKARASHTRRFSYLDRRLQPVKQLAAEWAARLGGSVPMVMHYYESLGLESQPDCVHSGIVIDAPSQKAAIGIHAVAFDEGMLELPTGVLIPRNRTTQLVVVRHNYPAGERPELFAVCREIASSPFEEVVGPRELTISPDRTHLKTAPVTPFSLFGNRYAENDAGFNTRLSYKGYLIPHSGGYSFPRLVNRAIKTQLN